MVEQNVGCGDDHNARVWSGSVWFSYAILSFTFFYFSRSYLYFRPFKTLVSAVSKPQVPWLLPSIGDGVYLWPHEEVPTVSQ